jgi:hypothetical protein
LKTTPAAPLKSAATGRVLASIFSASLRIER